MYREKFRIIDYINEKKFAPPRSISYLQEAFKWMLRSISIRENGNADESLLMKHGEIEERENGIE